MRKLLSSYWLPVGLLTLVIACKRENLEAFSPEQTSSDIYFKQKYDYALDNERSEFFESRSISFGYVEKTVTDSVIKLPVRITGLAAAADREYVVEIDAASTMKKGVDFDMPDKPVFRAGKYIDTLAITLHRTAGIKQDTLSLGLILKPNTNFTTNIIRKKTSNGRDSFAITRYDLKVDDIPTTAAAWTDPAIGTYIKGYFGDYSTEKLLLMAKVLKFEISYLTVLPPLTGDKYNILYKAMGWGPYMVFWLNKEKAAGRIYYDENGKEITMGPSSGG